MKKLYAFIVLMVLVSSAAIAGDTTLYVGGEWLSGAGSASNTLDLLTHTNNDNGKPVEIYTFGSVGGTTTFTLYYRDQGNNTNQVVTMTMVDGMSFSSLTDKMPRVDSVTVARANVNIHAYFHAWAER